MNAPVEMAKIIASAPHAVMGYRDFKLGSFGFRRDEYFAHIEWSTRDGRPMSHSMDIGNFLRALMRDVAWGFFYGGVNFDEVIGSEIFIESWMVIEKDLRYEERGHYLHTNRGDSQ